MDINENDAKVNYEVITLRKPFRGLFLTSQRAHSEFFFRCLKSKVSELFLVVLIAKSNAVSFIHRPPLSGGYFARIWYGFEPFSLLQTLI